MGSERGVACSNMVSRKANMKKRGPGRMAPGKFLRKGGIHPYLFKEGGSCVWTSLLIFFHHADEEDNHN